MISGSDPSAPSPHRRNSALFLALALALSLAVPAFAAGDDSRFSDVAAGAPCAGAVDWAVEQGYINGYNGNRFGVGDSVARQQVAAILWRWAGRPDADLYEIMREQPHTSAA